MVRRKVLLPAIFAPVMMQILPFFTISKSFEILSEDLISGCPIFEAQKRLVPSDNEGKT